MSSMATVRSRERMLIRSRMQAKLDGHRMLLVSIAVSFAPSDTVRSDQCGGTSEQRVLYG